MEIKKEIQEILQEPITGHPSREFEQRVKRLERAVIYLADRADFIGQNTNWS